MPVKFIDSALFCSWHVVHRAFGCGRTNSGRTEESQQVRIRLLIIPYSRFNGQEQYIQHSKSVTWNLDQTLRIDLPKIRCRTSWFQWIYNTWFMMCEYELICALYTNTEFDKNNQKQLKGGLFCVNGWKSEVTWGTIIKPVLSNTSVIRFSCVIRHWSFSLWFTLCNPTQILSPCSLRSKQFSLYLTFI